MIVTNFVSECCDIRFVYCSISNWSYMNAAGQFPMQQIHCCNTLLLVGYSDYSIMVHYGLIYRESIPGKSV